MSSTPSCIVVEDDRDFAELLEQYIDRSGSLNRLATYGDTANAARNIEKLKPDIIFLDINISGLEGPEVMEVVRHKPEIIMVSGHPPEVMENYNIEVSEYLQKPFSEKQFLEVINRCVNKLK